jgi:t-SNARE complex subunit (syntaxin)
MSCCEGRRTDVLQIYIIIIIIIIIIITIVISMQSDASRFCV